MNWVRVHPLVANWPGGGVPPTFDISADENGAAVVELAWDPQALLAPGTYTDPLRYYSSDVAFSAPLTRADGSSYTLNVPAQSIRLNGNRATWVMPTDLWNAYVEEALKTLARTPQSTFSRNIYYRVRVTAPGASTAVIWPVDATLRGANCSAAPHIGILPVSMSPTAQVVPDSAALQAMGGIPFLPTLWSDMLLWMWRNLPESDAGRRVLVAMFAHATFQNTTVAVRASLLKLWLFAGPSARQKLSQLLDRRTVVGSQLTQPIIEKTDLRGGKTLVENLLELLSITPHPDFVGVTTKEQLLDDVITEILDPNGQVNQGAAGSCSPTSLQTLLITINPAEYVRLQLGLLSSSGRVVLANGATADVPAAIFQAARYIPHTGNQPFLLRTNSELAFQATMLKYGRGATFPAFTGTPENINLIFQQTMEQGLLSDQTKRVLDGIFNVNFTTHYIPAGDQATIQAAQPALRDGVVRDLPGQQQQMLMAMFWSQPYQFGHVVMAVRREAGSSRIFFKNPQYPGSHPAPGVVLGGNAANPPRRYEDPTQTLESIAESDLLTWIKGYWVPDTAII